MLHILVPVAGRDPGMSHLLDVKWNFLVASLILLQVLGSSECGVQVLNGILDTAWLYDSERVLQEIVSVILSDLVVDQLSSGALWYTYLFMHMASGDHSINISQLMSATWKNHCSLFSNMRSDCCYHIAILQLYLWVEHEIVSLSCYLIQAQFHWVEHSP
jgi:hypothetical protein